IQAGVRRVYSSPPLNGARLVSTVLYDPALARQWDRDVAAMRARIKRMRTGLAARLAARVAGASLCYVVEERGLLSLCVIHI
ncbi:aromatic amino acid aminotransferase, partial [Burkholderia pseudomallei]